MFDIKACVVFSGFIIMCCSLIASLVLIILGGVDMTDNVTCPVGTIRWADNTCIQLIESEYIRYENATHSSKTYENGIIMLSVGCAVLGLVILLCIFLICCDKDDR
jgi:hypothetical protein